MRVHYTTERGFGQTTAKKPDPFRGPVFFGNRTLESQLRLPVIEIAATGAGSSRRHIAVHRLAPGTIVFHLPSRLGIAVQFGLAIEVAPGLAIRGAAAVLTHAGPIPLVRYGIIGTRTERRSGLRLPVHTQGSGGRIARGPESRIRIGSRRGGIRRSGTDAVRYSQRAALRRIRSAVQSVACPGPFVTVQRKVGRGRIGGNPCQGSIPTFTGGASPVERSESVLVALRTSARCVRLPRLGTGNGICPVVASAGPSEGAAVDGTRDAPRDADSAERRRQGIIGSGIAACRLEHGHIHPRGTRSPMSAFFGTETGIAPTLRGRGIKHARSAPAGTGPGDGHRIPVDDDVHRRTGRHPCAPGRCLTRWKKEPRERYDKKHP